MDLVSQSVVVEFIALLGLGAFVAIIWAAGFVVWGLKQLRKDFDGHTKSCNQERKQQLSMREEQVQNTTKIESAERRLDHLESKCANI